MTIVARGLGISSPTVATVVINDGYDVECNDTSLAVSLGEIDVDLVIEDTVVAVQMTESVFVIELEDNSIEIEVSE